MPSDDDDDEPEPLDAHTAAIESWEVLDKGLSPALFEAETEKRYAREDERFEMICLSSWSILLFAMNDSDRTGSLLVTGPVVGMLESSSLMDVMYMV